MKIKICGITTVEDGVTAVSLNTDMLGFNFYPPSKRYITPSACAALIAEMEARGARATWVGVFVNSPVDEIRAIMEQCGLHLAQLHGDEPPSMLAELGAAAFRAIRPSSPSEAEAQIAALPHRPPPAFLIDAYRPDEYGGSGTVGDWELAKTIAARAPILLAGGLTAENAATAVAQVHPWGVDVASGVESAPGIKDAAKMKAFIEAVRGAGG